MEAKIKGEGRRQSEEKREEFLVGGGTKRTRFTKSVLPLFRRILHLETCVIYKTEALSWKPGMAVMWCMPCVKSLKWVSLLHAYAFKAEGNGSRYERFRVCAPPSVYVHCDTSTAGKKNMAMWSWIPVLESLIMVQTTLPGEEVMVALDSISFFFSSLCVIGYENTSEMQYLKFFTGTH